MIMMIDLITIKLEIDNLPVKPPSVCPKLGVFEIVGLCMFILSMHYFIPFDFYVLHLIHLSIWAHSGLKQKCHSGVQNYVL